MAPTSQSAPLTAQTRLARAYVSALIAVTALVILSQVLIQILLTGQENDAQVINVAGRQRMLSQKIVKEILRAETSAEPAGGTGELQADLHLWQTEHQHLRGGRVGSRQTANSADIERLFEALEPHFQEMAKITHAFLERHAEATKAKTTIPGISSAALRSTERQYLTLMNEIVFAYEREARDRVTRLQIIEFSLAAFALAILLAASLLLFRPITRQVRETIEELNIARSEAEALSRHDGLTGIANRRHFDEKLEREMRRCARSHEPVAIVMLDLDNFKELNDRMGHDAGDKCLARVAHSLSDQMLRPGDLVARYGGDEFVVCLPETDLRRARLVAARLEQAIASLQIGAGGNVGAGPPVTISCGVAAAVPTGAPDDSAKLVKEADRDLCDRKVAMRSSSRQVLILRPAVAPLTGRGS